jgi:hypothetical protein
MAYNSPDHNAVWSRPPRRWVKPTIIAFVAAFILLAGTVFAIGMLQSHPSDGAAGTAGSTFREAFLKSFVPVFRNGCVKSADAALTQHGVDLSAGGVGTKIETYCTCAAGHAANELSIPELIAFKLNPSSEPAASKMKNIIQECQAK